MFTRSVVYLFLILFTSPSFAETLRAPECASQRMGGRSVHWCKDQGDPGSADVVYYFHGIGGSEKKWSGTRLRTALGERSRRSGALRPTVFSISFGVAWFFTDLKSLGRDPRIDIFYRELMPKLEAELGRPVERRIAAGESMGGYNSLRLVMEKPELFSAVIALCPALLPIGPYSSDAEIEAFKERNKPYLQAKRLETLRWWAMLEFPNQADWTRNNPLDRGTNPDLRLPPLFLATSLRDEYGFREGSEKFRDDVTARGLGVEYRAEEVGHCRFTDELVAESAAFLLR